MPPVVVDVLYTSNDVAAEGIVVTSLVPVRAIRGIRIPLFVLDTSSLALALGVNVPIPIFCE